MVGFQIFLFYFSSDAMDTEEGAKQKNLAMAKKKFNMDPKKVRFLFLKVIGQSCFLEIVHFVITCFR